MPIIKIAVTGHRGFIGSHLIARLKSEGGYDVIGIDLKEDKDIRTLSANDLEGVRYIFHTAAQPKVPLSIERPEFTHDHNINGTINLLMRAREAGVERIIFSASSSAYGEQDKMPLTEDMTPNPMSPYAVQKLVGEQYMRVFADLYNIETVSLRYFNVYGEGMPIDGSYSACIAIFLDKMEEDEPLPVLGGFQTRDFTYIKDVVEANILAMKSSNVGKGEVINIGGGDNVSINKIAETLSDNIEYLPQREGEAMDTLADISKAKEFLGWQPTQNVIEWLKSQK